MAKTKLSRFTVMVLLLVMMMTLVVVAAAAAGGERCQQMRGECRLVTWEEEGMSTRNISCYCKHGEDVARVLNQLSRVNCLNVAGGQVNTSILHIVGCNVSSEFPKALLTTCRASTHLSLYVESCPWLSFTSPAPSAHAPATITATFLHSNVSGMPEGVVSGAGLKATIKVEGGEMGVIESHSFSGYPSDAQVSVSFRDTKILTVKQGSFDLPPAAKMEVQGGQILKLERHSYSGGAALTLSGLRVGNLLPHALNIYGLKKLNVTSCTMATVYADALEHRPPTYVRNITSGQEVLEGSEAIFSDNSFMSGNGAAFVQLCTVERLVWSNNTMLTTNDMPFRLQGPRCNTQRKWSLVFSMNALSCQNCTYFSNPDDQTCELYKSGYCISCEKMMDECHKPILPYLITKCLASHPHIARDLNNTCEVTTPNRVRTPKALQDSRAENKAASFTSLLSMVILCVMALLLVPE